jgi:heterodisulfide reductase subunit A
MRETVHEFEVGTIVVATGMDVFDPTGMEEYGYGRFPNVVTSLEFERLINAGGPTLGEVVRPGDRRRPRSVAFVQCVGSRSTSGAGKPYCSNVCCMVTIKDTLMLKEHYPGMEITVFYLDIRAFGKGFEDLYTRSREAGVRYLRGLPGLIEEDASGTWVRSRTPHRAQRTASTWRCSRSASCRAPTTSTSRRCSRCRRPPTASSSRRTPS